MRTPKMLPFLALMLTLAPAGATDKEGGRATAQLPPAVPVQAVPAQPVPVFPGQTLPGAVDPATAVPTLSQMLMQAGSMYKASPSPASFAEFLRIFKAYIAQPGAQKLPAAALIRANPILSELGAKAIDAGSGRVWLFPRIASNHEVIVQWQDTKATTVIVGRRRPVKRVTYTTVSRMQSLALPQSIHLKEARVIGGEAGARLLVLVGDGSDGSIWLRAYKSVDGAWVEAPTQFESIPTFLTQNMSGTVHFRGSDMIFNVGRIVAAPGSSTRLPESESSTYRFWVKLVETGYALQKHVPDVAQFAVVRQFLEAVAANRTDIARSLLTDAKLLSIPKYVGVKGPSSSFRVVQMASPPSGAPRYRIITGQRADLIFEVARVKDKQVIRAIFIAPPDAFLQEIAKMLPTYDQLIPPPPPVDATAAEPKRP